MEQEPKVIIVKEKSDGTAVKMATIFGLICASPLLIVFGSLTIISVIAIVFGTMHSLVPLLLVALLVASFLPAVRERLSGKHDSKALEERMALLEKELSDARQQILQLEEGADFQHKLKLSESAKMQIKKSEEQH